MAKEKRLSISSLTVNKENYRFEPVASQKEAIDKMIEDQQGNLYVLATHMLANGLNPDDKIKALASNQEKNKFIVLEGNRRVITLKLMLNPELIEGAKFVNLKKKFKKLHEENKTRLIKQVSCLVYDDPKEAELWIGLKHGYGPVGVVTNGWNPLQKHRFSDTTEGKTAQSLQIINLLKGSPDVPDSVKHNIEKIPTSNLDRLIDDPAVRNFLGIEISGGIIQSKIDQTEVVKGLSKVAEHLLDKGFKVKSIYTRDDRKKYIKDFPKSSRPNIAKKSDQPWQFNTVSIKAAATSSPTATTSQPRNRKTLIPKNCIINIQVPKLNAIYHELKSLDLKYSNAASVLFRVFIELSVDSYVETHKLAASALSAQKSNMSLQNKIQVVANHMESKRFADGNICKGIVAAVKDKHDLMGIDTWHSYVHNNRFQPKSENLIITWDNIQEFVITLWNNIK